LAICQQGIIFVILLKFLANTPTMQLLLIKRKVMLCLLSTLDWLRVLQKTCRLKKEFSSLETSNRKSSLEKETGCIGFFS